MILKKTLNTVMYKIKQSKKVYMYVAHKVIIIEEWLGGGLRKAMIEYSFLQNTYNPKK